MAEPIRCERTIRRAIARGDLPAYRLGKRGGKLIRLRADDVDRFMRPIPSARSRQNAPGALSTLRLPALLDEAVIGRSTPPCPRPTGQGPRSIAGAMGQPGAVTQVAGVLVAQPAGSTGAAGHVPRSWQGGLMTRSVAFALDCGMRTLRSHVGSATLGARPPQEIQ